MVDGLLPDGAGVYHVEIPIDGRPHSVRFMGEPLEVTVTADGNSMRFWTAAHAAEPGERTVQVFAYHASLLGVQQELPGDAVPRGDTGVQPDGWRWCLYELVDGR